MATYHEPTAISGGDTYDYNMRVKAWEWVNIITMFTATMKSLRLREDTAEEGYDVSVLSWAAEYALNGIHKAERAAEALFLESTDSDAYKQFTKSKFAEQRRRGILTCEEYWQAFARFLTEYEPF